MPDVQPPNTNTPESRSTEQNTVDYMTDLLDRLKSESVRNQLQLVKQLAESGETGRKGLMTFLLERSSQSMGMIEGAAYQILYADNTAEAQTFLQAHFPQGIVPLHSERDIDYTPLQQALAKQDFLTADRLTLEKLCELAGELAIQRKWLYFTEVERFPITDLQTIDTLWRVHSEGKFGYSVQRDVWLGAGKDWEKLWTQIGWKSGNNWTRYPNEFTWSLAAPKGHLPLSNQLRGVRVINALLSHPAWQ
ncbi:GUN4 domain-containing protein [Thermocoleostomius sinensis]|uniref:GUN4 N-terminal ARM-like repeat domain-containing protein n=1 Tax=Thermocoleostomius sinensis A174 TaxID=2016057 RepID=A0A9E8ZL73_9CYAN|nr:GUN4 N-terminal ARM-like repeat domain-containing protein [Thermocoleostomius sinensis A174]